VPSVDVPWVVVECNMGRNIGDMQNMDSLVADTECKLEAWPFHYYTVIQSSLHSPWDCGENPCSFLLHLRRRDTACGGKAQAVPDERVCDNMHRPLKL